VVRAVLLAETGLPVELLHCRRAADPLAGGSGAGGVARVRCEEAARVMWGPGRRSCGGLFPADAARAWKLSLPLCCRFVN
jgi:hypothetical protein